MSVYKDKKRGTWYVMLLYKDIHGNRKQKCVRGFKTKKAALEKEKDLREILEGSDDNTLVNFVEVYFNDKSGELKERSVETKRHMIRTHIIPYFGEKRMSEITSTEIIAWQNEMRSKDYSPSYLRMIANQLNALLGHAVTFYGLKVNPYKKVKKMGKSDDKRILYWTLDEYRLFLGGLEENSLYYVLFEILFWTGCREGEMLALTPADFDFKKRTMRINKTYYRRNRTDYVFTPKTESSIRTIEIPSFLCDEVKNYIESMYKLPDDERIFQITFEAVQHKLKHVCEETGVKRIPVHCIRHASASYLVDQGVDPLLIKERLGHKDVSVTLNTYSHLYPSKGRVLADMMDQEATNYKKAEANKKEIDN